MNAAVVKPQITAIENIFTKESGNNKTLSHITWHVQLPRNYEKEDLKFQTKLKFLIFCSFNNSIWCNDSSFCNQRWILQHFIADAAFQKAYIWESCETDALKLMSMPLFASILKKRRQLPQQVADKNCRTKRFTIWILSVTLEQHKKYISAIFYVKYARLDISAHYKKHHLDE